MNDIKIKRLEEAIQKLREKIMAIGDMRPGSLSRQMRKAKGKYGAYWHLSYTHRGKGHTQYVRDAFVEQIQSETRAFKRFRALVDRLVALSIKKSELRMELQKADASNQVKTR